MFGKSWRRLAPLAVLPALLLAACGGSGDSSSDGGSSDTIKVGLLHSLSGTMAISEVTVRDSELLAIEQINAKGGVLGKKLVPVVEDGASDWPTFAEKAQKLISQDKVATVFGGWTSASRKAMLPVFERNKALLWYPVQYEGLEQSPYIFYTGATTNQQIVPGLDYLKEQGKKKIFLVGSDYVFPRTANKIIKAYAAANGMDILGEEYLPLGSTEVSTIVNKVQQAKPDFVFNTLNGDSNVAFFKQLKSAGIGPDQIPTMSVSIAEEEVKAIGTEYLAGQYVAWNYYQTTDTPANTEFVKAFKAKYGSDKVTSDPMEAGYNAVNLWAAAVEKAGTTDVEAVKKAAGGISLDLPEGKVTIDGPTQHVYKTARIGLIGADGQIKSIWDSGEPIKPDPYLKGAEYPWAKGLSS
ncbi:MULTISPECIES: urea ABC transporter substrate-binding protein [unclassified Pseudofrankia]|uniref:urea ABC transporter substrate-binding protein n=1 Tax=unclassified Pseudofrankia TaxID=2994372 RepID=UPI0008D9D2C9|nr:MULTISPECIES: urea ABC transporter substrate-binding protein [unclassified Pseudofrankia]MDT3442069.1 urea ABC transporter substrate-binding protein [Pseudofrankia sp. BMG5.37]OHV47278.1 urea ABC transporter substrate-binding protein [Pseudofrankia sp. BMG5.36]